MPLLADHQVALKCFSLRLPLSNSIDCSACVLDLPRHHDVAHFADGLLPHLFEPKRRVRRRLGSEAHPFVGKTDGLFESYRGW